MNVGIIGQGFVGNAVYHKFKKFYNVLTYDLNSKICNSTEKDIIEKCTIVFICVPTPMNKDGSCDISIIESVLKIFPSDKKYILILKSTVPPGTTEKFNLKLKNIQMVFNPEFLTERNAVEDYNNQNRIILGGPRPATTTVKNIFSKTFPNAHIIKTGSTHAEMIKYFTNTFLATKVTFANEMYDLCVKLKLDYDKVVEYSILDDRIGKTHLNVPGPDGDFGFGGHCFPKDLSALIKLTEDLSSTNYLLKSLLKTNDTVRRNRDWEKMKGRAIN